MGQLYDRYADQVARIWNKAHAVEKQCDPGISWCCGIINGRGDYEDLQMQGAALAASIILQHDAVPRIFIGWDSPRSHDVMSKSEKLQQTCPPLYLMSLFGNGVIDLRKAFEGYVCQSQHVSLIRSPVSVNPWPYSLGLGYRAKYLGSLFPTTDHIVISDIDTIVAKPCMEYLRQQIAFDPETFCITNWYSERDVSVGLCVYNTHKYRMIFLPLLARHAWELHRRDSSFIQFLRKRYPRQKLDMRIMDRNKISAERYWRSRARKNNWTEDTMFYHSWKGELVKGGEQFLDYYGSILDSLESKADAN